jgi:hypothetical protein
MRKLVVILAVGGLVFGLIAATSAYAQIGGIAKSAGKAVAKEQAKQKATGAAKEAAKQATKAKPAKPGKFSGTISSVSDSSLVVSQGSGAAKKDETFVLNAQTKKEGNLQTGGKATVQYKVDGSNKVATSVKASPPKAAKAAKAPKAAKPKEAKAKKK